MIIDIVWLKNTTKKATPQQEQLFVFNF